MYPGVHASTTPDKAAIVMADGGESMTYAELDAYAHRLANLFQAHGLEPGDHVALCMENRLEFLPILWGAHYAGLYYTAISSRLTAGEMAYIIGDCGARAYVTSPYKAAEAAALDGPDRRRRTASRCRRRHRRLPAARTAPRRPAHRTPGAPGRGQRHAVLLGHHRPAQGREGPRQRRTARHARHPRAAPRPVVRCHRRDHLPLPRAALPRSPAAVLSHDASLRRHGRGDGALRPGRHAGGHRAPRRHLHAGRTHHVRATPEARRRGPVPATTCRRWSASSTPQRPAPSRSKSR